MLINNLGKTTSILKMPDGTQLPKGEITGLFNEFLLPGLSPDETRGLTGTQLYREAQKIGKIPSHFWRVFLIKHFEHFPFFVANEKYNNSDEENSWVEVLVPGEKLEFPWESSKTNEHAFYLPEVVLEESNSGITVWTLFPERARGKNGKNANNLAKILECPVEVKRAWCCSINGIAFTTDISTDVICNARPNERATLSLSTSVLQPSHSQLDTENEYYFYREQKPMTFINFPFFPGEKYPETVLAANGPWNLMVKPSMIEKLLAEGWPLSTEGES